MSVDEGAVAENRTGNSLQLLLFRGRFYPITCALALSISDVRGWSGEPPKTRARPWEGPKEMPGAPVNLLRMRQRRPGDGIYM